MALKIYPNGLRLSVIPRNQSKLASVCLMVTSGTQSEKNYEAGISEFVSRMLVMGTKEHPSYQLLNGYAKKNGIVLSSSNTAESIIVSAVTTTENVSKAVDLLCDIAFNSNFDIESGNRVRNSMLSDIYKLQENPSYTLERLVNQALFYRTGLANPKFGTVTTISRMTSTDAKNFFKRVLTPKNTVLSIVGDVDADVIYEQVMQTFYSKFIDGGDYKKLKYVATIEDFVGGERTKNKKLNQSRLFLSFPSLSYKNSKKYTLDIISPIVLKAISKNLSEAQYFHAENITHEVYANNGKLTIECMVDYEHTNEYLEKIVEAIRDLRVNKISQQDFDAEKKAFIVEFLRSTDRAEDLAITAGREVAISKQSYSVSSELLKVDLLSAVDANQVLEEVFNFNKLYVVYLGNAIDIESLEYVE